MTNRISWNNEKDVTELHPDRITPQDRLAEEVVKLKANLTLLETSMKALLVDLAQTRADVEQVERVFMDLKQTYVRGTK